MAKNLIICLDVLEDFGLSGRRTNVLKLYYALARDETQVTTYISGPRRQKEGNNSNPVLEVLKPLLKLDPIEFSLSLFGALTKSEEAARISAYAFGSGIVEQLASAYAFLTDHYEDSDKVFLFGFSRAASVACLAASFVQQFGLIQQQYTSETHAVVRHYAKQAREAHAYRELPGAPLFKSAFSKECNIHFLGLWETLEITGWIMNPMVIPGVQNLEMTVRHAVSIDERRCLFRQRLLSAPWMAENPRSHEVWFPGVHSDVGGGYPEPESDLSQIALEWMIGEAVLAGLKLDPGLAKNVLGLQRSEVIPDAVQPNPSGRIHESLAGPWWPWELLPHYRTDPQTKSRKIVIPLGRRREIAPGSKLHRSVLDRMEMVKTYRPSNLPPEYHVLETVAPFFQEST